MRRMSVARPRTEPSTAPSWEGVRAEGGAAGASCWLVGAGGGGGGVGEGGGLLVVSSGLSPPRVTSAVMVVKGRVMVWVMMRVRAWRWGVGGVGVVTSMVVAGWRAESLDENA